MHTCTFKEYLNFFHPLFFMNNLTHLVLWFKRKSETYAYTLFFENTSTSVI